MKIHTLTIVGVGLIGGSLALAARRRGLVQRVLGVGRNPASLEQARRRGIIDEGLLDLAAAAGQAEIVVFCTPVDCIARQVVEAAAGCAPGTLLTDAGSTKGAIVRALSGQLPASVAFVGSHPLAGSEKRGAEHADAELFQDRLTIVTQALTTDLAALEKIGAFWRAVGSRVLIMDPEEHDRALALTSHLPHLAASALAGILLPELYELTASGFRDTTRIAAGDPAIWTSIFAQNRLALLAALERLTGRLGEFRQALERDDGAALDHLWKQGKKVRDALGN